MPTGNSSSEWALLVAVSVSVSVIRFVSVNQLRVYTLQDCNYYWFQFYVSFEVLCRQFCVITCVLHKLVGTNKLVSSESSQYLLLI